MNLHGLTAGRLWVVVMLVAMATSLALAGDASADSPTGGPYSTNEGAQVTFSGAASDPEDLSKNLTYEWDFAFDGSFNVAKSGVDLTAPTHSYTDNGSFTVALRVRDSADNVSSISTGTVTVVNVAPSANAGGPYAVDAGTEVTFRGAATDPGNDTLTYEWDFEYNGTTLICS